MISLLRHKAEQQAATLPALLIEAERAASSVLTGEHGQRRTGAGEKFWQFREYVPGDRPQDIDWRQSAKGDKVFIREKEWATHQTAFFWLNGTKGMHYHSHKKLPTKLECARLLSLSMAILMRRAEERIGWLREPQSAGRSEKALQTLAEHMHKNNSEELPGPSSADMLPRNSNLIMVSDFLSPLDEIEKLFNTLREKSKNALILQVLDPAELELPFTGRAIFEDFTPSSSKHHIAHVKSVQAAYQERINTQITTLQQLCHKHQWNYGLHRTDGDIHDTLASIWHMLSQNASSYQGGRL